MSDSDERVEDSVEEEDSPMSAEPMDPVIDADEPEKLPAYVQVSVIVSMDPY